MITYTIYVVDDEPTIREGISSALEMDYDVIPFPSAEDVLLAIEKKPPDLVLLDIGLPGKDGITALKEIKTMNPLILVIMITAYEDIETVIAAMKLGAYDYVVKPIHMNSLEVTIGNALETIKLRKEVESLQEELLQENLPIFIAKSNASENVMDLIELVAKSPDTPILIQGETGTGKELIAKAIHYRSPNFKGPLIAVNCAAIPRDLIESELFGYEKGAFSGANTMGKRGLIEEAQQGTLFLDEIGDLSQEGQAKLLRFLEEGEFYRIGGITKHNVQTRIVSASNKNLEDMIHQGTFRNDLYFRLGVIKIEVPSLNDRPEDIIPLANHFLLQFNQKFNKNFKGFTQEAERALKENVWIGNIRELRNFIERAVLLSKGITIDTQDLGLTGSQTIRDSELKQSEVNIEPLTNSGLDLTEVLEKLEKHYIQEALILAKGNESKAATLLKINHHTFRYRRKKLNAELP